MLASITDPMIIARNVAAICRLRLGLKYPTVHSTYGHIPIPDAII